MTINSLLERVKALDINKVSVDSLNDTSRDRETLNIEQINNGFRADGSPILPSYTELTIQIKKAKGQPYDRVTLQDTGDFYRGIKSSVNGNSIITDSTDSKSAKLKKKYETSRGKLFGLGKEAKAEYIDKDLRPTFNGKIEAATGLKIKK
jgi:hypothetical protein